jgi:hypothetical protein
MDVRHPRQRRSLVGNQYIAANARRREIFLHGGVFGVIALDGAGMVTGFDDGNELIETGSRWHQSLMVARKAAPSTAPALRACLCRAAALAGDAADGSVGNCGDRRVDLPIELGVDHASKFGPLKGPVLA